MQLQNRHLNLELDADRLLVRRRDTGATAILSWPAVGLSCGGRVVRPQGALEPPRRCRGGLVQRFEADGIVFEVGLSLGSGPWLRKTLRLSSDRDRPTPDWVEVDRQALPSDGLRPCGYLASTPARPRRTEEEGGTVLPGCGYPLIGRTWFLGLEHPAAFNHVTAAADGDACRLRHHPVWAGRGMECVPAVLGWSADARESFADYLDTIRLPRLRRPMVAFGTFWSDPYVGRGEYAVSYDAYRRFFEAFRRLGLVPDLFTLDAGWQDRRSVFQAKAAVGGDAGLARLRRLAVAMGSDLSLWVSHNGHMGIAPEFLREHGFAVGGGNSGTYNGDGFAVMLDDGFVAALEGRFRELVGALAVAHLKIDWDNDCATAPAFAERWPTTDHVREATLNAFFRIARALREANPQIVTRNGWWPSPWWLREAHHVWLSDSGDCEYAALPSATQRDAASTHRDLMYYNHLRRDATPLPLDCFDNHEFPDALRNPFGADPSSWTNAIWLAFLRGATYLPFTLMPESLEPWQAESLARVMAFCRANARHLYVARGRMVLGHPGRGEIYGFLQPGPRQSWCVLRNPLPVPQTLRLDPAALAGHPVQSVLQYYPHHDALDTAGEVVFLGHEVKAIILSRRALRAPSDAPCQIEPGAAGGAVCRFPSTLTRSARLRPLLDPLQQIPALACTAARAEQRDDAMVYAWTLCSPSRTRGLQLQLCLHGPHSAAIGLQAFVSRYPGGGPGGYALPVTLIPRGLTGHGEARNRDVTCDPEATYVTIPVPDGGICGLHLTLQGVPSKGVVKAAWLAGYEAPSREAVRLARPPRPFAGCLPVQHPLGFGRALALPLPAPGE